MRDYVILPAELESKLKDVIKKTHASPPEGKSVNALEEWKNLYWEQRWYEDEKLPLGKRVHKGDSLVNWGVCVSSQNKQEGNHLIFLAFVEDLLDSDTFTDALRNNAYKALDTQYVPKKIIDGVQIQIQKMISDGNIPKYPEPMLNLETQKVLGKPIEQDKPVFKLPLKAESTYQAGSNGECPHCGRLVTFVKSNSRIKGAKYPDFLKTESGTDNVYVYSSKCPNPDCNKPIVIAIVTVDGKTSLRLIHPFGVVRIVPQAVPDAIKQDFLEASSVLPISEKASAALSRRCLQNMLDDQGISGRTLEKQIEAAIKDLPTRLGLNIDAIRQVGNYAAHAVKSEMTGTITDVENGEALWNLYVLEQLFDFYYVQPMVDKEKREQIDAKLKQCGKPPLKKP